MVRPCTSTENATTANVTITMSSRSEGTSISLLEAMSAGLCPIVTRVGGNAAVLGEHLTHRLVPSEDPSALAMAYHECLTNSNRRRADGARASQRIKTHFSVTAMVEQYERLYDGSV